MSQKNKAAVVADVDTEDAEGNAAKPAKPAAATDMKSVTCKADLRVIVPHTGNAVLFEGGKARVVNETIAFAAQAAGANEKVLVDIKDAK